MTTIQIQTINNDYFEQVVAVYLRPGMMPGYCVDGSNVIESIVNKVLSVTLLLLCVKD